jgi:hypothetical protein
MAGDWFPLQYWRSRCPEIVRVSSATGRTRHEILGWVCDFWSWVSTESADGTVPGIYLRHLPEILGADLGLWEALAAAGWIAEREGEGGGIVVPGWETWLCESGKKRLKDRLRKKLDRARGRESGVRETSAKRPRNVPGSSAKRPPTGQDRTGEKKKDNPLPPSGVQGGGEGEVGWKPFDPPTPDLSPGAADDNPWAEPLGALVAAWMAARLPGNGIEENSTRRGLWQQRLADDSWRARWREAVARAGRSSACRGEDPNFLKRGLRIDTFLREPNMLTRILEGEFDDGPGKGRAGGNRPGDRPTGVTRVGGRPAAATGPVPGGAPADAGAGGAAGRTADDLFRPP